MSYIDSDYDNLLQHYKTLPHEGLELFDRQVNRMKPFSIQIEHQNCPVEKLFADKLAEGLSQDIFNNNDRFVIQHCKVIIDLKALLAACYINCSFHTKR